MTSLCICAGKPNKVSDARGKPCSSQLPSMEGAPPRPRIVTPAGLVALHQEQAAARGSRAVAPRAADAASGRQPISGADARQQRAANGASSQGDAGACCLFISSLQSFSTWQ